MMVRGHSALTAIAFRAQFAGEPEHDEAHAELGHRIGGVRREPFLLHVERRRDHQDVRIGGLFQIRDGPFRDHEGAARVDLMHEVEPLHVGVGDAGELDRAGIVDDDIDAAELLRRLVERVAAPALRRGRRRRAAAPCRRRARSSSAAV